ncbi:helix-turn-helix transcriptional regulator [Vibrio sp. TBV020]|uniref:helix-turn-helix transcriptional regulator n=1 Tax=Vibrio sp. TBV020 TaxID=3137398 RepID=UPI0038CD1D8C
MKIIKLKQVLDKLWFGKTRLMRLIERGEFPRQIKLGERATGWLESEVDRWVAEHKSTRIAVQSLTASHVMLNQVFRQ